VSLVSGLSSPSKLHLTELAASLDASYWADRCAWVPGTGHCRDRDCSADCLFRPQRNAEARQVVVRRRRRRGAQQPFTDRGSTR